MTGCHPGISVDTAGSNLNQKSWVQLPPGYLFHTVGKKIQLDKEYVKSYALNKLFIDVYTIQIL